MTSRAAVLDALASVRDPELDEPLTELGFVRDVTVEESAVHVHLRLPTFFCSPGFVYMMVADSRAAVAALPGAGSVEVEVDDHFAGGAISTALDGEGGFAAAFPGETAGEPEALRGRFQRKALVARQGRIAQRLLAAGGSLERLAALTLGELPRDVDRERCRALREELGLPCAPGDAAFVRPDGAPLDGAAALERFLRIARLVSVSLEGNGDLCRGLLRTRYGNAEEVGRSV